MTPASPASSVATTSRGDLPTTVAIDADPAVGRRQRAVTWLELRQASGLLLRQLEERSGINRGEISKIERGRSCASPDQARHLLDALGETGS